jgi:hypothetical protein
VMAYLKANDRHPLRASPSGGGSAAAQEATLPTAGRLLWAPARAVGSLVTELFAGAPKQNPAFGTVGGVLKKPTGNYAARRSRLGAGL